MTRGWIAYAAGSPCPTLVLLREDGWPTRRSALSGLLHGVYETLCARGAGHVLKIALVSPSTASAVGLDYRFVQVVPGEPNRLEFGGSCGHSILSAVLSASRAGTPAPLRAGDRVRVRVLNNEDIVVCEALEVGPAGGHATFTVRFRRTSPTRLGSTLLLGEPVSTLPDGGPPFSLVSLGNPYVFADARAFGVHTEAELFGAGEPLFRRLSGLREAVARRLGWTSPCFPKIAALLPGAQGALSARAISVPSWHPSLALTGATCLAAASAVPGTVPARLGALPGERLTIRTPGGDSVVRVTASADRLLEVSVSPKTVRMVAVLDLPDLAPAPEPTLSAP
ncbi:PrpF domain-containing protein [Streptomyces physcomitrii]|uniref:Uncharacterized protein n=1 Tax=Streptomyces physcomitrii TaxID=2724184 RepID=A0ABX1H3J7_9ACTN|nr:PrpF domain-containing protein [Streptomyces physcomitrii]NKI42932.1 hypothetical protein [Streptomyces physcomitrii]